MALNFFGARILSKYLTRAQTLLSLGYPDLLLTEDECVALFGVRPRKLIDTGTQHGLTEPIPETAAFLEELGVQMRCVDIVRSRDVEQVLDLNYPHDLGSFDIVLDPGTIEHCANIGQALMNAANAVCPLGRILHISPVTMVNHGFYNICPTLLHDFYQQNGWSIEEFHVRDRRGIGKLIEAYSTTRYPLPPECAMYVLAQRRSARDLKWPTQTKYLRAQT